MPVSKTKRTTLTSDPSTSEPSSPVLPEQQVFHQYLRTLAQSAIRIVIGTVMREELDQFVGVAWGKCSPKRKGYRNGHYTRDLVTSTGRLEEINVPIDRAGQFHTQAFERYRRYEPHIAEGRDGDVCGWDEHPQGGRSGPNLTGRGSKSTAPLVA
jgi:putative transposase